MQKPDFLRNLGYQLKNNLSNLKENNRVDYEKEKIYNSRIKSKEFCHSD